MSEYTNLRSTAQGRSVDASNCSFFYNGVVFGTMNYSPSLGPDYSDYHLTYDGEIVDNLAWEYRKQFQGATEIIRPIVLNILQPPQYTISIEPVYGSNNISVRTRRVTLGLSAVMSDIYAEELNGNSLDSVAREIKDLDITAITALLTTPNKKLILPRQMLGLNKAMALGDLYGVKPRACQFTPLGGLMYRITWACEAYINPGAREHGSDDLTGVREPSSFSYRQQFGIRPSGLQTRVIDVVFTKHMDYGAKGTISVSADVYRDSVDIPIPMGFRRDEQSWTISEDFSTLTGRFVDNELEGTPEQYFETCTGTFQMETASVPIYWAQSSAVLSIRGLIKPGISRSAVAAICHNRNLGAMASIMDYMIASNRAFAAIYRQSPVMSAIWPLQVTLTWGLYEGFREFEYTVRYSMVGDINSLLKWGNFYDFSTPTCNEQVWAESMYGRNSHLPAVSPGGNRDRLNMAKYGFDGLGPVQYVNQTLHAHQVGHNARCTNNPPGVYPDDGQDPSLYPVRSSLTGLPLHQIGYVRHYEAGRPTTTPVAFAEPRPDAYNSYMKHDVKVSVSKNPASSSHKPAMPHVPGQSTTDAGADNPGAVKTFDIKAPVGALVSYQGPSGGSSGVAIEMRGLPTYKIYLEFHGVRVGYRPSQPHIKNIRIDGQDIAVYETGSLDLEAPRQIGNIYTYPVWEMKTRQEYYVDQPINYVRGCSQITFPQLDDSITADLMAGQLGDPIA